MNRIKELFQNKKANILSVYFTAGFPSLNDTVPVIENLEKKGADLIEIGIPFSDPLADGPTIQRSSEVALRNGMSIRFLFSQLECIREKVKIPLVLMGYLNPILQYGIEKFCTKASDIGIDGLIIPDLPLKDYQKFYKPVFEKQGLLKIFLITPQTTDDRIRMIDRCSEGFIYSVSSDSTTGKNSGITNASTDYFERINQLKLKNPTLIGFGINDKATFKTACAHSSGAIIGSEFIRHLENFKGIESATSEFFNKIKS